MLIATYELAFDVLLVTMYTLEFNKLGINTMNLWFIFKDKSVYR